MDPEPFSNPIAPAHLEILAKSEQSEAHPLTNEDFRKLLMTPRAGGSGSGSRNEPKSARVPGKLDSENRKKKKKLYAAIKKQDDDLLAELAKRYRDRAKERRENANPDYQGDDPSVTMAAYHAVAPDIKSTVDQAERRKQLIEESKYLGGDMKHTHLVKGLDYALLHKVKAELVNDEEEIEDFEVERGEEEEVELKSDRRKLSSDKDSESIWAPKSVMAANIINLLNKDKLPDQNELFLPGRMAYIVDLEDECADEIPTTIIRSKADCPSASNSSLLSTNNIVINKLIQIVADLRQGGSKKRKKEKVSAHEREKNRKPDSKETSEANANAISIYDDIGDYVPRQEKRRERSKESRRDTKNSYFDKPSSSSHDETRGDKDRSSRSSILGSVPNSIELRKISRLDQEAPDSYAECYPGAPENDDAIIDSDDEIDFSKMDSGNKKSTVGRWDFDTQEEYGEYMSKKEALPKAAFQYGVKMADGRRTRRIPNKKDDKAKLDRDFQKISAMLAKRKVDSSDSSMKSLAAGVSHDRDHKRLKN